MWTIRALWRVGSSSFRSRWKNATERRALIHLGCQPRGAVDDDDEEDEGKHAVKKQFDTTCTIEFVGSSGSNPIPTIPLCDCEIRSELNSTSPLHHTIHIVPFPVDADVRLIDISRISIIPFSIFNPTFSPTLTDEQHSSFPPHSDTSPLPLGERVIDPSLMTTPCPSCCTAE
ncbi:hypothetical protein BLNAU_12154 [Blattamonas nauphoetae]|uniref:Uncharacterized protein n=1 Tax=Blattamonas nauphoetae TaxID=2049346 RepID=A0ABQ9XNC1_9EUKA|nr:hypothetical protein BLNAU_12154 [Blattamonas nauphoetae]